LGAITGVTCAFWIIYDGGPSKTTIHINKVLYINKVEYNNIDVVFVDIILKRRVVEILEDNLGDPHLSHKQ